MCWSPEILAAWPKVKNLLSIFRKKNIAMMFNSRAKAASFDGAVKNLMMEGKEVVDLHSEDCVLFRKTHFVVHAKHLVADVVLSIAYYKSYRVIVAYLNRENIKSSKYNMPNLYNL